MMVVSVPVVCEQDHQTLFAWGTYTASLQAIMPLHKNRVWPHKTIWTPYFMQGCYLQQYKHPMHKILHDNAPMRNRL